MNTNKTRITLPIDPDKSAWELIKLWDEQARLERNSQTGCLEWTGSVNNSGLPIATVQNKQITVNRIVLARKLGRELASGEIAYQSCRNPKCLNPDHLELIADSARKPSYYRTRLSRETIERMKPLKDKFPHYNRNLKGEKWIASVVRHLVKIALDAIENNQLITELIDPVPDDGKTITVRFDQDTLDRIESQRQEEETKLAVFKRLIDTGLQVSGL